MISEVTHNTKWINDSFPRESECIDLNMVWMEISADM